MYLQQKRTFNAMNASAEVKATLAVGEFLQNAPFKEIYWF